MKCPMLWHNIETTPLGNFRPCCLIDDEIKRSDGTKYTVNDDIAEVFNSDWKHKSLEKVRLAEANFSNSSKGSEKKSKHKIKCTEMLTGFHLCENAPRLICGTQCGKSSLCPCCYYGPESKKRHCK